MPKRVQMTRRPGGWRHEHPDAVIVARPSRWGNPYKARAKYVLDLGPEAKGVRFVQARRPADEAVALFRDMLARAPLSDDGSTVYDEIRRELAGRDLACWCPLDQPCHADVLLELANEEATS